jgi:glycerophosphoryl diester phosphodiesterase
MHKPFFDLYKQAWNDFRKALRPVIGFEFWFSLVYAIVLAPLAAWLLNKLLVSGEQVAIGNEDIIIFLISFRGIAFVLSSIAFFLAHGFLEYVGLMIIFVSGADGRETSIRSVLRDNFARIFSVIRLGFLQALLYGAAGTPFVLATALIYRFLLTTHDISYYLSVKPWQWWISLGVVGACMVGFLMIAACLYVRLLFAVPLVVFENRKPAAALKRSWQMTRHRVWALGIPQAVWWLLVLLASVATTWAFKAFFAYLLAPVGLQLAIIIPLVVVALSVIIVTDLAWLVIGKAVHASLIVHFYQEAIGRETRLIREPSRAKKPFLPIADKRVWIGVGLAFVAAIAIGAVYLETLNLDRRIAVTAHRGSSLKAPENTMSALRHAIEDRADFAEIDVQTTADGVVILMHDADLMRTASVDRRIRDVRYEELREIDIGSWFSEDFRDERVATLEEAIALAQGRIRLNIELKYNRPDPALSDKVGQIIRKNSFAEDCVVTSLNYDELQGFRQSFPEIKTGFIVARALGSITQTESDFLSIHTAQATSRLVKKAHKTGKKIHVWTVNDLRTALSMIEVGVDNIITDKPGFVLDVITRWNSLSDSEKIALWLRNLLIEDDHTLGAEL